MAYGSNAPFGLQPDASILGVTWTEKTNLYKIPATTANGVTTGYASSVFTGDPVIFNTSNAAATFINTAGNIAMYNPTYTDGTPSTFGTTPILGVFMGCEYFSTVVSTNNLIKSPFYPASAQIQPNTEIKAWVLDDPMAIFNIQLSTHVDATANAFDGLAPVLPVINPANANQVTLAGSFGSNFALNIGGGTNFNTINLAANTSANYANNPATGNVLTGQSAFYVDVTTTTGGGLTHDYDKTLASLPLKLIGYMENPENVGQNNPVEANTGNYTRANTPFLNVRAMINNHMYKVGQVGVIFA